MIHKPPPFEHLCGVLLSLRRGVPPTFIELCYANQLSMNMPAHDRERAFLHWVVNPDELEKAKQSGDRDEQLLMVNERARACTYGPNSNAPDYAPTWSETEAMLEGYDSLPILYSEAMSAMRAATEANNAEVLAAARMVAETVGNMINYVDAVNNAEGGNASSAVADGDKTPTADVAVADGDKTPTADVAVAGGAQTPPADEKTEVASEQKDEEKEGQRTPPADDVSYETKREHGDGRELIDKHDTSPNNNKDEFEEFSMATGSDNRATVINGRRLWPTS